jgi:hypothetical protein
MQDRIRTLLTALALLVPMYVLSSGPVLASAFWLRDRTGWDGFYAVIWLYLPLLYFQPRGYLHAYIEWWVNRFGTAGPG